MLGRAKDVLLHCYRLAGYLKSDWLFTSTGKKCLDGQTVVNMVRVVVDEMKAANLVASDFTFRDLRRTAETRMAKDFSSETRAYLLRHGISGVQARHYDLYDRWDEKCAATEWWQAYVERCVEAAGKAHSAKKNVGKMVPTTLQVVNFMAQLSDAVATTEWPVV